MMYLEDFLEIAEGLPIDFTNKLNEVRELDEKVEKIKASCIEKSDKAFKKAALKRINSADEEPMFEDIKKDLEKASELSAHKVRIIESLYDVSDRHLRKLDIELNKYKMELEADNDGITEILERRALENENFNLETGRSPLPTKEKKRNVEHTSEPFNILKDDFEKKIKIQTELDVFNHNDFEGPSICQKITLNPTPKKISTTSTNILSNHLKQTSSLKHEILKDTNQHPINIASPSVLPDSRLTPKSLQYSNNLHKIDCISNYQRDYQTGEFLETSGVESGTGESASGPRPSRTKKQTSRAAAWEQERLQAAEARGGSRRRDHLLPGSDEGIEASGDSNNWNPDPNEPRYCICNQVSYGAMVGCDNKNCAIEWFHYDCVGVEEAPKGKWYCPPCSAAIKKSRRNR